MLKFKFDVNEALKRQYKISEIIKQGKISSATLDRIRKGKVPAAESINALCLLLRCQPGDLLECIFTDEEKIKYF